MKKLVFIPIILILLASCSTSPPATSADRIESFHGSYDKIFNATKSALFDLGYHIESMQKDEGYIEALTSVSTLFGTVWKQHKILLMNEGDTTRIKVNIFLISGPAKQEAPQSFYDEFWEALTGYLPKE